MDGALIVGRDPCDGQGRRLILEDGRIASIEPCVVEENLFVAHGLIDLQVNGFGGLDLNAEDLSAATVCALAHKLLRTGVTTFAPTLITGAQERLLQALRAIAEARELDRSVAQCIPFVHMEGPWISPEDGYRGAHPQNHVRAPDLHEFDRWQGASGGLIRIVTLSPHWENAPKSIAELVRRNVRVAIGHTHATAEQIRTAVDAGASLATHLGNGVPLLIARHPNPIWSQLAEERLWCSFIADGFHLPADVLRAMLKAKGVERSILVSDAVALAGMPPGRYTTPVGGEVALSADGRLTVAGGGLLAGAAAPLIDSIGRCVRMTALPLHTALRMATENPGRLMQVEGTLHAGARADVLQFSWDESSSTIRPTATWLAGKRIGDRSKNSSDTP